MPAVPAIPKSTSVAIKRTVGTTMPKLPLAVPVVPKTVGQLWPRGTK